MGWDQVSILYFDAIARSNLSFREKAGLYYVFPGRWMACSIGLIAGIVHPIVALVYAGYPWGPWLNAELLIGGAFYSVSTCVMLSQLVIHQAWRSWAFVLLFYFTGPVYLCFQASLVLYSLFSIIAKRDNGWVVTQRALPSGTAAGAETPARAAPALSGPGLSSLSPFRKPSAADAAGEPTLGFTLTRYYTVDRPDSVSGELDGADAPAAGDGRRGGAAATGAGVDVEAAPAMLLNGEARARAPLLSNGASYHRML